MTRKSAEPTTTTRSASLRDFVAVLFRRKWIIAGVFFVTTAVTTGVILSQPVVYQSIGKVLVKRGVRDNLLAVVPRTFTWEEDMASEVETAQSPAVLAEAQTRLDDEAKAKGQESIRINPEAVGAQVIGESNVLAIGYHDRDPEVCTRVTDVLLVAYTEYRRRNYELQYPADFFEGEIKRVQDAMQKLGAERGALLESAGLVDELNNRQALLTEGGWSKLSVMELQKQATEMRSTLQGMYEYQKDPATMPDVPFATSTGSGNEQVVSNLKADLMKAQVRYSELSSIYKPDFPDLVRLRAHIEEVRHLLDKEVRNRIRVQEMQLAAKESQLREAQSTLGSVEGKLSSLPGVEAKLAVIEQQITGLQENHKELMKRSGESKIGQATGRTWTVLLLSPASAAKAQTTRDYVRIALAPLFSLVVGIGLAFFVESLDTSLRSPRDAEESLELPVLASLMEQKR
jgi:uncharacterized protein involved in exopolysaccharide biosynthesis